MGIWECAVLGFCVAEIGCFLPTFRNNLSFSSYGLTGRIDCPETSARNYRSALHNIPKQNISHLHCNRSLKLGMGICVTSCCFWLFTYLLHMNQATYKFSCFIFVQVVTLPVTVSSLFCISFLYTALLSQEIFSRLSETFFIKHNI